MLFRSVVAIVFGVIPLVQSRRMAQLSPPEESLRVEVSGSSVQVDSSNTRVNQYIQAYIEQLHSPAVPAQGSVVVGEVPKRAPAFQPRAELVALLQRERAGCHSGAGGNRDARGGQDADRGGVCPVLH